MCALRNAGPLLGHRRNLVAVALVALPLDEGDTRYAHSVTEASSNRTADGSGGSSERGSATFCSTGSCCPWWQLSLWRSG